MFAGQGAQHPGMGLALSQSSPAAAKVFDDADRILGWKLSELCFQGPQEELPACAHCQPAIFTVSAACFAVFRKKYPNCTFDGIERGWCSRFGAAAETVKAYYARIRKRCDRGFAELLVQLKAEDTEFLDDSHFSRNVHELHTVAELKDDLAVLESFDGTGLEGEAKRKFDDLKLCARHYVMTLETLLSQSEEDKARLIAFRAQHKTLFSQNWWTQWNKGEYWLWNGSKEKADYENSAITTWMDDWELNAAKRK